MFRRQRPHYTLDPSAIAAEVENQLTSTSDGPINVLVGYDQDDNAVRATLVRRGGELSFDKEFYGDNPELTNRLNDILWGILAGLDLGLTRERKALEMVRIAEIELGKIRDQVEQLHNDQLVKINEGLGK